MAVRRDDGEHVVAGEKRGAYSGEQLGRGVGRVAKRQRRSADRRLQLGGRALGDDQATIDDADPAAEPIGLLHVVRAQHDRHLERGIETLQHLPDRDAGAWVEALGRLVEEEDRREMDQSRGEVDAALHPARVVPYALVGRVFQIDQAEQEVGAPDGVAP